MDRTYSSRYKGVSRRSDNRTNPRTAYARIDGKQRHLGNFSTEDEAAAAHRSVMAMAGTATGKSPRWVWAVACYEDERDWFEIELSEDRWAKVSVEDIPLVVGKCWSSQSEGYAYRVDHRRGRAVLMHREIMGLADAIPEE